jgi:peptidyl-tRNA hydrolase, PTH1 family
MKLLVGLGNPGDAYAKNRHNVGFLALDRMVAHYRLPAWKRRFAGVASDGEMDGARVLLLKPETFMNESGRAVGEALRFLKLTPADLIVLHDELDLEPGRVKVKTGGGNAGHNGLRSISGLVGNDYVRVRIGIGHPGHKDAVSGYVLHDFAKAERVWLDPLLDEMARAAGALLTDKPEAFAAQVMRAVAGDAPNDLPPPKSPVARESKSSHPAGERASKQKSALAENLRKWTEGKKRP